MGKHNIWFFTVGSGGIVTAIPILYPDMNELLALCMLWGGIAFIILNAIWILTYYIMQGLQSTEGVVSTVQKPKKSSKAWQHNEIFTLSQIAYLSVGQEPGYTPGVGTEPYPIFQNLMNAVKTKELEVHKMHQWQSDIEVKRKDIYDYFQKKQLPSKFKF